VLGRLVLALAVEGLLLLLMELLLPMEEDLLVAPEPGLTDDGLLELAEPVDRPSELLLPGVDGR
jgi:hypothetical protein